MTMTSKAANAAWEVLYARTGPALTVDVEDVDAALSAALPHISTGVKPLEWVVWCDGWQAHTPFGSYTVEPYDGCWKWRYCFDEYYDEEEFICEGAEDGKSKAQAHWIERISPALYPESVSNGWRDIDDSTPTDGFIMVWSPDHPDLAMIWKAEYFHSARRTGTPKHLSANHFTKWRRIPLPVTPAQEDQE
ncbi:hypothetical protein F9K94_17510 [Brucella tritici]|uniref:Uncharacterized protein n=1 Tax=Brucella tritici TaxID=94626 RepID=A0A7V7VSY7_9HYPH|nr:hypothetical protein [Brucella tritici]KAB2656296.1 hypothetical protein F9K94_17510 [Brucella tritici]